LFIDIPSEMVSLSPGMDWTITVSATAEPLDIRFFWTWQGQTVEGNSLAFGTSGRRSQLMITIPEESTTVSVEARSPGGSAFSGDIPIQVAAPTAWDSWTEHPDALPAGQFFTAQSAYGNGHYVFAYNGNPGAITPAGVAWSTDGSDDLNRAAAPRSALYAFAQVLNVATNPFGGLASTECHDGKRDRCDE
jgi:hypothetical protein